MGEAMGTAGGRRPGAHSVERATRPSRGRGFWAYGWSRSPLDAITLILLTNCAASCSALLVHSTEKVYRGAHAEGESFKDSVRYCRARRKGGLMLSSKWVTGTEGLQHSSNLEPSSPGRKEKHVHRKAPGPAN